MSVENKRADPAILRKFGLSKQEESLKQRLMKKGGQNQSASKSGNNSPKSATVKSSSTLKNDLSLSNKRREHSEADKMTEQFLKSMEKEFQDLNKKQISMGMLNTNTEILKRQTEILNENQMNIANMIKDNKQQSMRATGNLTEDAQKQLMRSIIGPINEEIKEIKQMYENTRHLAENVQRSVNDYRYMTERGETHNPQQYEQYQRAMDTSFGNYRSMNSNLRDMVYHAQGDLSQMLPENMQIIQQMSDLNVQAYTNCINNLKKQIEDLQRDAEKAEKELESRYKKLSQVPKPGTIKPTDPYYPLVANGPETSEDVIKNVRTIDFQTSRQILMNKLGGEFDYENFNHEVSELANSIHDIRNQALEEAATYEIDLPSELELLEYDRNIVSATVTAPSILDEIKAKYNVPRQMVMPKPVISQNVSSPPMYSQNQFGPLPSSLEEQNKEGHLRPKKKSLRPREFDYIRTVPQEPLPDVRYSKIGEQPRMKFEPAPAELPKKSQEAPRREPTYQPETRNSQQQKEEAEEDYGQEKFEAEEEENKRPVPAKTESRGPQTYINMDRYDMKIGSQNQVNPRGDHELSFEQVRGTDALFNRLFEGLLLQDIKEQIVYSNVHPSENAGENSPRFRVQESPVQAPPMKANIPGNIQGNTQLYYPQLLTSQQNELKTDVIDDKLLHQLTLEAFAEKLLPSLKSELTKEQQSSIFQPVQSKPIPDIQPAAQNNAASQQNALLNLANNTELPTLIAENIMNLFNSAMMQINTSLSKNFGQISQVDPLNLRNKQEIDRTVAQFTRKEEQKEPTQQILREKLHEEPLRQPEGLSSKPNLFSKSRKESQQKDEIEQGFDTASAQKETSKKTETKKPVTLYDALNREQKLIQEEQDILRQRKHFLSPAQNLASQFGMSPQQGYYFGAQEPQPIANLSEYYRELQSDMSNSEVNISRPASVRHVWDPSPGEVRRNWGTPSHQDNDMLSEGQVFPNFDQRIEQGYGSEAGEVPGFSATKTMTMGGDSEMSIDPRFNTIQKGGLTDNLFKNVHEEDREPGEVNIFNIFRA